MKIDITSFDGIMPKRGKHLLEQSGAVAARNCRLGSGMFRPLGVMQQTGVNLTGKDSFYRWKGTWLTFSDWRFFAPGQVYGKEQRLYMSKENGGLYTYRNSLTPKDVKLGCPEPTAKPVANITDPDNSEFTKETRVYVYTCVNSLGEESAPSPPSKSIDVQGQTVHLTGMQTPSSTGYAPITKKYLYRLAVGNETAGYLYVKEFTGTATDDNVSDADLGEALKTEGWHVPDYNPGNDPDYKMLRGLTVITNSSYAAFHGNEVRFSEPLYPYAWPDTLSYTVEYDIVGISRSAVYLFIFTTGPVYYMSIDDLATAVPVRMDGVYPCASAKGIISVPGGVVFPCADGLYFVGAGYSRPVKLSAAYFDTPEWDALNPSSMFGDYAKGTTYLFWKNGNRSGGLLLRMGIDEGGNAAIQQMTTTDADVKGVCVDQESGDLFVKVNNECMLWEGDLGHRMDAVWQSKSFLTGNKVNFSCAIVEQEIEDNPVHNSTGAAVARELPEHTAQGSGYVRVYFYRDGKEFYWRNVTDREAFVLPSGFTGRTLQMRIETNRDIRRIAVAESMAELFA